MAELEELEQINNLTQSGDFTKALEKVDSIKTEKETDLDKFFTLQVKKCDILNCLGKYEEAIACAQALKEEAKLFRNHLVELDALNQQIFAFYRINKIERGLNLAQEAEVLLSNFDEEEIEERKSQLLVNKIYLFTDKGEIDQAFLLAQQNFYLCKYMKDQSQLARAYHVLGWTHMHKGELDEAITQYEKSLEIREKLGNLDSIAYTQFALGYVWRTKGELELAKEYFLKSLKIRKIIGNQQDIAWTILNLGDIYNGLQEYKKAETYYEESLIINQKNQYTYGIVYSLMRLGLVYETMDQSQLVIDTLKKALNYAKEVENIDSEIYVLFSLIYFMSKKQLKGISKYIPRLKEIQNKYSNPIFNQIYRLSVALKLKNSSSTTRRKKARIIFQEITNEKILNYYFTKIAMSSYIDILKDELQKYIGDDKLIGQLVELSDKLSLNRFQYSYSNVAENFINETQIALDAVDITKARELLNQAQYLCDFLHLYEKGSTTFQILYLLFIKERGLNELSNLLNITKGAVSNHLKLLTNLNLVEVSREEQVRSATMLKKYYSLGEKGRALISPLFRNIKTSLEKNDLKSENLIDSLMIPRLTTKIIRDITHIIDNFQYFLEEQIILEPLESKNAKRISQKEMVQIKKLFDKHDELRINQTFLSNKQYKKYMILWKEFQEKVKKEVLTEKELFSKPSTEKSNYVLQMFVPLNEFIQLERDLDKLKRKRKKNK